MAFTLHSSCSNFTLSLSGQKWCGETDRREEPTLVVVVGVTPPLLPLSSPGLMKAEQDEIADKVRIKNKISIGTQSL